MTALHTGPDGQLRCTWCAATPDYIAYHDEEWGFPVADDRRLFEKLSLEAFQSGLSWRTILTKRANFRAGFAGFDIEVLATWGEAEVQRLLGDAGIVRHRGKIEAVLNNARRAQELIRDEGSLAAYVWRHEPTRDDPPEAGPVVGQTAVSQAISKDLKRRGWAFVGPTTVYAFMQAMGLVNDHATGCAWRARVTAARRAFQRPV
jgi:DNA-3-methyladenine glycosylase I